MSSDRRIIAVEYGKPKYSHRFFGATIDGMLLILATLSLFALAFLAGTHTRVYTGAQETTVRVQKASGLYVENPNDPGDMLLVSDYYQATEESGMTQQEVNNTLDRRLTSFFLDENALFFSGDEGIIFYNSQKAQSGYFSENENLPDSDPSKYSVKVGVDVIYPFYVDACERAVGFLQRNKDYTDASKVIFWTTAVCVVIAYLIAYVLVFLMVPQICHRGYKTLGMLALKYGRLYVDGLNMTRSRFLLRFLFGFLLHGIGFVAIFIPPAISIAMSMYGKYGQTLPDYLANTYVVDTAKTEIYFTPREYLRAIQDGAIPAAELTPEQRESQRRDLGEWTETEDKS